MNDVFLDAVVCRSATHNQKPGEKTQEFLKFQLFQFHTFSVYM